jgi:ArsR family transcriptional regulator, arsenate/arsenite/antimonite-responsive transcriptional repressor
MDSENAMETLAALAQATRLDAFRLLVKHAPGGLPAGDIARLLGVQHNTLSAHFSVLSRAGLVAAERRSRSIIYRADVGAIQRLAAFLVEDCCGGRLGDCAPALAERARPRAEGRS